MQALTQQLFVSAQDLHKVKPVKSPAWVEEGSPVPTLVRGAIIGS